jgi:hypothetical protein
LKRALCVVLFSFFCVWGLAAREVSFLGSFFDIPEGWEAISVTQDKFIFAAPQEGGFFQGKWYPKSAYTSVEDFHRSVMKDLKAKGEGDAFSFNGRSAFLSDLRFSSGGNGFYGFGLFVSLDEYWLVLLSFTTEDLYDAVNPFLVSVLDSFSADSFDLLSPGPMSQYLYPFPGPERAEVRLPVGKSELTFLFDKKELDAASSVVERETRIMAAYDGSPTGIAAWKRFYRMVYRDNYGRIELVSRRLNALLGGTEDRRLFAEKLLSWLQGFTYIQTGTLVISPVETLLTARGDCDSRSLLYVILLRQLGYDAVLMVSLDYGHALGAVDVEGGGGRFSFEGKQYVVAETTEEVGLGLIERTMADPKGWIGVSLR